MLQWQPANGPRKWREVAGHPTDGGRTAPLQTTGGAQSRGGVGRQHWAAARRTGGPRGGLGRRRCSAPAAASAHGGVASSRRRSVAATAVPGRSGGRRGVAKAPGRSWRRRRAAAAALGQIWREEGRGARRREGAAVGRSVGGAQNCGREAMAWAAAGGDATGGRRGGLGRAPRKSTSRGSGERLRGERESCAGEREIVKKI